MKNELFCVTILFCVAAAGCSQSGGKSAVPTGPAASVALAGRASTDALARQDGCPCFNVIYSFGGVPNDAIEPTAALTSANGLLYGTTQSGGMYNKGTVFSLTVNGVETVLHSFGAPGDGALPYSSLVVGADGRLYGTTQNGGANNFGTVYRITKTGEETIVHSFRASCCEEKADGNYPQATLIDVNGVLYGTTLLGGAYQYGTVFSITEGGKETVLHSFAPHSTSPADGGDPYDLGGLVYLNGLLYGTTGFGGIYGGGIVFSMTTGGTEQILHDFGASGSGDGTQISAGVVAVNGVLYGATQGSENGEFGNLFSLTPGGTETTLHYIDAPYGSGAPLVYMNQHLFGISGGGTNNSGVIFGVWPDGSYRVAHNFGQPPDAAYPQAGLLEVKGVLYSTTIAGGAHGMGTVYSFKP